MNAERIDAIVIEEHRSLSISELGERWGVNIAQLQDLLETGVIEPSTIRSGHGRFTLESAAFVRTACRLQQELELDAHAVGVVLGLLERVRALERELQALRARQPGEVQD